MMSFREMLLFALITLFAFNVNAQSANSLNQNKGNTLRGDTNPNLCAGSLGDPIVNITFGSGDNPGKPLEKIVAGATTTYNYVPVYGSPASPVVYDGSYTITNNTVLLDPWFSGMPDHTPNDANGYMAFFNSSANPGVFYQQTVKGLCGNTKYEFAAWIANVLNPAVMVGQNPDITFLIEDINGNKIASFATGSINQTSTFQWNKYGFFFKLPVGTSDVVLKVINSNPGGENFPGNDFALDDITFSACGPQLGASFDASTFKDQLSICAGKPFTLYGDVSITDQYDYLWQISNDAGATWEDIPNSNKLTLDALAPAEGGGKEFLYRMLSAEKGNITSKYCRVVSNVATLNVLANCGNNDPCSNWLNINTVDGAVRIGDLDVSGTKITVEATFNRTQPRSQSSELYAGDLVSKHTGPENVNYLLRPNTAEITTDKGYFRTPDICDIELNKTYHVAMTYDGATLKFYRNGFLMSSAPASGNLFQNDLITTIGNLAYRPGYGVEGMLGYINEVRIWNTVRTQAQINTYLDKSLPNPTTQAGLLAYYTFNDLANIQGNTKWNGTLINGAAINSFNPACSNYTKDSCDVIPQPPLTVIPSFNSPDTVCINTPVQLSNTSTGASSYYWSFCTADINQTPTGDNLGNINSSFSLPVYSDIINVNGSYYVFVTNNSPGGLVRLDYGNSLLNNPVAVPLGNLNGIPNNAEGIQIVSNNGNYYAIIVGGDPQSNIESFILKVDFGKSITNTSPDVSNWGNVGNLSYPHDLYMFNENGKWYGFTTNFYTNTITKFDFGGDFNSAPVATNIGNMGNLSWPVGIYVMNDAGQYHAFITNAKSNTLTRLDFGNSLLNTPAAFNLGNLNNTLHQCWDIYIIKYCNEIKGFILNGDDAYNDIVSLNFPNNDITKVPTAQSLGNIGNLSFPHSISKLFREGADVYSFIPNAHNNTLTRIKFPGCTAASVSSSAAQTPPTFSYKTPGTYNITLAVDEGLPTQSSTCRQIVAVAPPATHPVFDTAFCEGTSINLVSLSNGNNYIWNTGATTASIAVADVGKYWVTTDVYGCEATDSFYVSTLAAPVLELGNDTALCKGDSLFVFAQNSGSTYLWQDGSINDYLKIGTDGVYSVAVTNVQGCIAKDTIAVSQLAAPVLSGLQDKTICRNDTAQLAIVATGNNNSFYWQPNATLSALDIANPLAAPQNSTTYFVSVKNENGCTSKDSVQVNVLARPTVSVGTDTTVCKGTPITLTASADNATIYKWSPSQSLSSSSMLSPIAAPTVTTTYTIAAGNGVCTANDELTVHVKELPAVKANSDTTICGTVTIQLSATGANSYTWYPAIALNNATIQNPVASPSQTTMYHVKGTGGNGCMNEDSVIISVAPLPKFSISAAKSEVCFGDSTIVTASGGDVYTWDASPDVLQPNNATTFIKPAYTGTYKVVVINSTCKVTDTLSTTLSIAPKPVIQVTHSNDIDCTTNTTTLTAVGAGNYTWTPASTLTNSNASSTVAMPTETTIYHVKATGNNGCITEDSVKVEVIIANAEHAYQMASAFTPNNDGINDCFGVKKWSIVNELDFSIYNRWGALLFRGNKTADCWDGTYKGLPQASDAYIYIIKAKTLCGNIYKKGTVVLIR